MKHVLELLTITGPVTSKPSYVTRLMGIQPAYLLGAWVLSETTGRTAVNAANKFYPNLEHFDNGGFEIAGGGGADIWANTQEVAGNGALSDETIEVHAGGSAHAAKITAGASANTYIRPTQNSSMYANDIKVFPGQTLILTFWTRGDGVNAGRYSVYDNNNGVYIRSTISTGITGVTYAQVSYSFVIPSGCYDILVSLLCPTANGGICYFDDVSLIGNMPYNGLYAAAGMTYNISGPGDGRGAARFSGADTGLLIGSKAFGLSYNGNVGSVIAWGKVDAAARWTDATSYRYLFHPKSRQDATVYIVIGKNQTNHQLVWRRRVASTTYEKLYTFSPSGPTGWFSMGFRWNMLSSPKNFAGFVYAPGHTAFTKVFDETPSVGYGDQLWDTATYTVDDANCVLAGGSITAQEWFGDEARAFYWAGAALTDNEFYKGMVI